MQCAVYCPAFAYPYMSIIWNIFAVIFYNLQGGNKNDHLIVNFN